MKICTNVQESNDQEYENKTDIDTDDDKIKNEINKWNKFLFKLKIVLNLDCLTKFFN